MSASRCFRCNRILKDPESVNRGYGPNCYQKVSGIPPKRKRSASAGRTHKSRSAIPPLPMHMDDVVCRRSFDGTALVNIPHLVKKHSPSGFEWGYGGSGPAELALNIVTVYAGQAKAELCYQAFKWDFIACMPEDGGTITKEEIQNWLRKRGLLDEQQPKK